MNTTEKTASNYRCVLLELESKISATQSMLCERIEKETHTGNRHVPSHHLYSVLEAWINALSPGILDTESMNRINRVLEISSPYFVYIEDLELQEMINFSRFSRILQKIETKD